MVSVAPLQACVLGCVTVVAGVGLAAVLYTTSRGPEPVAGLPPSPSVSSAPVVPSGEAGQPAEAEALPAPTIDVVRVAEDGGALVAGSAVAGAAVVLRVDGLTVAETSADNAGQFVALFMLAPSDAVQMMTLEMVLADGRTVVSDDRVVLAPRPEVVMAMVDAAPDATAMALAAVRADAPETPSSLPPSAPEPQAPGHEAASVVLGAAFGDGDLPGAEQAQVAVGDAPAAPEAEPAQVAEAVTAEVVAEPAAEAPSEEVAEDAAPESPTTRAAEVEAGEAADVPAQAPVIGADTLAAATPRADTPHPEALPEDALPTAAPISEAPSASPLSTQALRPGETPAGPETDDTQSIAQAGADLLPRAFVLRGSGEVALLDRAPQVMDNVVIDLIAYSAEGDVQISGRAAQPGNGARLQIYLDNQPIAVAVSENGDWASDLPDIDPGIYALRVDQLGAEGQVVSRFETPFQREDPALVREARARAEPAEVMSAEAAPAEVTPTEAAPTQTASAETTAVQTPVQPPPAEPVSQSPAPEPQGAVSSPVDTATATVSEPAAAPQPGQAASAEPSVGLITVQPGHSLWRISQGHYGAGDRYLVIYNANRSQIRNPDLIYPGQVFTLPD